MPDEEKDGGWKETLLGLVVIVVFLVVIIYAARVVYIKYFVPAPGVVSLSAYFVDDSGSAVSMDGPDSAKAHIKVKGDVSQGGQFVKTGSVRLTISSASNGLFRQSVYIPLQNGHFETEDPAFRSVRPGEPIEIKAEVTASGLNETATIYLNHKPPVESPVNTTMLGYGLLSAVLFLVVVFFVAFTGKRTPLKNRIAIIFSYLIIAIFLAVPILAPTFLVRTIPGEAAMVGAPVGLINTHTANQPDSETQWAINIGGYSFLALPNQARPPSKIKAVQDTTSEKSAAIRVESQANTDTVRPAALGSTSSSTTPASQTTTHSSDEAATTTT